MLIMDIKKIESLIDAIKDSAIGEVSVKRDGAAVTVRKSHNGFVVPFESGVSPAVGVHEEEQHPQAAPEVKAPAGTVIAAPMVGIFHAIDSMAAVGARIKRCQVVGAIESMKLMNEVVSDTEGSIIEVYIEDGMPVEYGQALYRLES